MSRRMLAMFLLLVLAISFAVTAGAVSLYVDTDLIQTDVPPTIVDGRTLVPMRAIFEALGAEVEWDGETRTATGTLDGHTVEIQVGETTAYVDGEARTLDVPAQLIQSRTMVPARFISEALGCTVTWDGETKTAAVANELRSTHIYITRTGKRYHYDDHCNGGTYFETTLADAMGRGLTPCQKCVG